MTVKEWLNRGYKLDKEINALLEERQKAFNLACKASAPPTDKERVCTSRVNSTEAKYIQYAEYTRLIDERIDVLYKVKDEIMTVISAVENNTYRTLLIMRYIQFKTWEQIAESLNYDISWLLRRCYGVHDKALEAAEKVYLKKKVGRD